MKTISLGVLFVTFALAEVVLGAPFFEDDADDYKTTTTETGNDTLPQDLYVIKTVVYEVGILTDADNSTDNSTDTHELVDLTFFDPKHNGSTVDLSNIPIPIQTNVSGIQVTGIAPANFGSIPIPPENESVVEPASNFPLNVPIIPNAVVSVTHNVSTTNPETSEQLLSVLPQILGLKPPFVTVPVTSTETSNTTEDELKEEHIKTGD